MKKTVRYKLFILLLACFATSLAKSDTVIVAGDEWLLSNQAFMQNPSNATEFAINVANSLSGTEYLIIGDADSTLAYGTEFLSVMSWIGKNLTVNREEPFSSDLLEGVDAVFLAGKVGSGAGMNADILNTFVLGGGDVYLSLATGKFGSAAAEANAWNPFLNKFGLTADSSWFPSQSILDIFTTQDGHLLENSVVSLTWGFGQEITAFAPPAEVVIYGQFGGALGVRGMVGVSTIPIPSTGD